MLSFALSTGTNFATSLFHLPFDEEEDKDIENYERKFITWVPEPAVPSPSTSGGDNTNVTRAPDTEETPFSSGSSSPCSLSACSSSASLSSMSSAGTSVSSGSATSVGHGDSSRSASYPSSSSCPPSTSKAMPTTTSSPPQSPRPNPQASRRLSHSRGSSTSSASMKGKERTFDTHTASSSTSSSSSTHPQSQHGESLIQEIMQDHDLYSILGVPPSRGQIDKNTLRRAYLGKSRLCHPDKFPNNPNATQAFQKVSIAYDVLSTPALKRRYDEHRAASVSPNTPTSSTSSTSEYDVFSRSRPSGYAEDTLRSAVIGVFNDFLDNGDLEVIRNLLKAVNSMNPGSPLTIGDEGIKAVLSTLHSIRERALTCRTCIYTLHAELDRLLEVQAEFGGLSYFDIIGRTRYAVKLSRIAVGLPVVLEKAFVGAERERQIQKEREREKGTGYLDGDGRVKGGEREQGSEEVEGVFPRHVMLVVRALDVALERMERILK